VAKIKSFKEESLGPIFIGVTMSGAMRAEIVARAAEKYNPLLKVVRIKDVLEIIAGYPTISLVKRKSLEVDVIIAGVDGRLVTFLMALDLHDPIADIESFLRDTVKQLLPDSELEVQKGALGGKIFLSEEPYRVPTPHNGAVYFLNSERETALTFLERNITEVR